MKTILFWLLKRNAGRKSSLRKTKIIRNRALRDSKSPLRIPENAQPAFDVRALTAFADMTAKRTQSLFVMILDISLNDVRQMIEVNVFGQAIIDECLRPDIMRHGLFLLRGCAVIDDGRKTDANRTEELMFHVKHGIQRGSNSTWRIHTE